MNVGKETDRKLLMEIAQMEARNVRPHTQNILILLMSVACK